MKIELFSLKMSLTFPLIDCKIIMIRISIDMTLCLRINMRRNRFGRRAKSEV